MKKPKVDRREKIVQAAIELFSERGIPVTRMSDIAQRARLDQPLISYYFPTTESLYEEVVARVLGHLKDMSIDAGARHPNDPKKVLAGYIGAYFIWASRNRGLYSIWLYFYYLAAYHPKFATLSHSIRETGRERIGTMIYRGVEKGVFKIPSGMTVADLALNVQGLMTGNFVMAFTEGDVDWKRFSDLTVRMVLSYLNA